MQRLPPSLRLAALVTAVGAAAIVLVVACRSTEDPRAGLGIPGAGSASSSTGGAGTSSGGVDAAIPDAPENCGPSPGATPAFTKAALVGAAADCAAWHACTFQNAAIALRSSVRAHATAPSDATLAAARSAWRAAMNEWSKMELFQFGPVAPATLDRYHGRSLRSFVHPWPDTNRCLVETQVVQKGYAKGWDAVFPSSRGLFAVEYLLHYPAADTACVAGSSTEQAWSALAPAALAVAKNEYAVAVADNLAAVALEIRRVWSPAGEAFAAKLLAHDGYGSEQEALNVVAWSLMYPEREIKDFKLASRAGLSDAAPIDESPFAGLGTDLIRTNLRAFRSLFQGCGADFTGIGFDDWLVAAGQQKLAADILAALAEAQAAADAFPAYPDASEAQFAAFYAAIKPLSDLLKTSFFGSASPLNLKLPATSASDTD